MFQQTEEERAREALQRRLSTLVTTLGLLSLGTLMVVLARLDAETYREDHRTLRLLSQLPRDLELSAADPKLGFNRHLDEAHGNLLGRCDAVRQRVLGEAVAAGCDSEAVNASLRASPKNFTAVDIVLDPDKDSWLQKRRGRVLVAGREARTVEDSLRLLDRLLIPRSLRVASKALELLPEEESPQDGRRIVRRATEGAKSLTRFYLDSDADELRAELSVRSLQGQRIPFGTKILRLAVEVESVQGPSLLDASSVKVGRFQQLASDEERRRRLSKTYGILDLETALRLTSEEAARTHKRVVLLGFEFSAERFPLAITLVFVVVMSLIAVTFEQARARQLPLISGAPQETVAGMLMRWGVTRAAVLLILPVLAVGSTSPGVEVSTPSLAALAIGLALIVVCGAHSLRRARSL